MYLAVLAIYIWTRCCLEERRESNRDWTCDLRRYGLPVVSEHKFIKMASIQGLS